MTISRDAGRMAALGVCLATVSLPGPTAEAECLSYRDRLHVSDLVPTGYTPGALERVGTTLYQADGQLGLFLFDVADPRHPVALGAATSLERASSLAVEGSVAMVAGRLGGEYGFFFLDVTAPTAPSILGSVIWTDYTSRGALSGGRAYGTSRDELIVMDVADPSAPSVLGTIGLAADANAFAVDGDVAYVHVEDTGLAVYDVSDPSSPTQLALVAELTFDARTVALTGGKLWVIDDRLQVVNVEDPSHPVIEETLTFDDPIWGVHEDGAIRYVYGDYVSAALSVDEVTGAIQVIASWASPTTLDMLVVDDVAISTAPHYAGLAITDVGRLVAAEPIASYGTGNQNRYSAMQSPYIYKSDADVGLRIIDVGDPLHPVEVENVRDVSIDGSAGVAVDGDVVYLAAADGIHAFDVTDPTELPLLWFFPWSSNVFDLVKTGDHLVFTSQSAVGVLKLGGASPVLESELAYDWAWSLTVHGDYVYVSDTAGSVKQLVVLKRNAVGRLALWNVVNLGVIIREMAISGDYGFFGGLGVMDLSDPVDPSIVAGWPDPTSWLFEGKVLLHDDVAYVSMFRDGLQLFDVRDPLAPTPIGRARTYLAGDLHTDGDYVFVACEDPGLIAYPTACGPAVGVEGVVMQIPPLASPNPFRALTTFPLAEAGGMLEIFDVAGGRVVRLRAPVRGDRVTWDGRDSAGRNVPPGVYFAREPRAAGGRTVRIVRQP